MKTFPVLFFAIALFSAGLGPGCKVPEVCYSYYSILDSLKTDFKETPSLNLSLPENKCIHIYQALYPYCGKINRHLTERTMEYALAMDKKCDGDTITYHRFSMIVFEEMNDPSPLKDTVVFISAHLKDYKDPFDVKTSTDKVTALGAITLYLGNFKNDKTIHFYKQMVFTRTYKCKFPLFCGFKRDNGLKGKPVNIDREMRLDSPYASVPCIMYNYNPTLQILKKPIGVGQIIENSSNGISSDKPLVFNINEIFKINSMKFELLTCKCGGDSPMMQQGN